MQGQGKSGRKVTDWIDGFLDWTSDASSPPHFRLWSGIAAVAGALERRVWTSSVVGILYPNLFVLLIAPPAIGKNQAIIPAVQLWRETRELKVAPNSVTSAALVDRLEKSHRKIMVNGELIDYHSLLVGAYEFGTFLPAHDTEFLSLLNDIYDNPEVYQQERRHMSKDIDISFPQLTILAGTQPAYLAGLLPEEAWGMGFMSRQIMIYSTIGIATPDLFYPSEEVAEEQELRKKALKSCLLHDMKEMLNLYGHMNWDRDAMEELNTWNKTGLHPRPEHSKLQHYAGRRIIHLLKLAMISAVSRGERKIGLKDVERSREWLLGAEEHMPDMFREMVLKSDVQVIHDLHFFAFQTWVRNGKKPLHEKMLVNFLMSKCPTDKINRILEMSDRANVVTRIAGTQYWLPQTKDKHGME